MSAARKQQRWTAVFILAVFSCTAVGSWAGNDGSLVSLSRCVTIVGVWLTVIGGMVFVKLDCERLGRETGPWMRLTLILGPGALCLYLISEYKERSLFLVPFVVVVYGGLWIGVPLGVTRLVQVWS